MKYCAEKIHTFLLISVLFLYLDAETLEDEILTEIGLYSIKTNVLQMLKSDDPRTAIRYLNDNASMWKHTTVRIAVAGKTFVGKSAFINVICGLNSTDEGSAVEGRNGGTLVVQEYRHHENNEIIYCELPSYGTHSMTRETFLENVNLLKYDLFVIFIYPILSEDDQWLIEQLREADKEFCFVRTRLDRDMKNSIALGIPKEKVVTGISLCVRNHIMHMSSIKEDVNIFFISNKNSSIGEMTNLVSFIKAKVPRLKCEANVFCLSSCAEKVIEVRYQMLQKRITSLSLALTYNNGLNFVRAEGEIKLYYQIFGLNIVDYQPQNLRHPFSADYIGTLLSRLCDELPGVFKTMVPIYSKVVSYRSFKTFFRQLLDELKDDCFTVIKDAISESQNDFSVPKCLLRITSDF